MSEYMIGSMLILPMLEGPEKGRLQEISEKLEVNTPDLNIGVRELFNREGGILKDCRRIRKDQLDRLVFGEREAYTLKVYDGREGSVSLEGMVLYIFKTGVAFAALQLSYDRIGTLAGICHPGYATGSCRYAFPDDPDTEVFLEERIAEALESLGLTCFYGKDALFLEAFTYHLALFPTRFQTLEEIRQLSFRLHLMSPPEGAASDLSEEDVGFVFAVKDQSLGSYRWGCCISSQTISYVSADVGMDFAGEMEAQINDGLPVVMLALYEKYTCLHFGRCLYNDEQNSSRKLRSLKREMLEFKAYGTVTSVTISRWYNVRMIYENLLRFFGVPEAVDEISDKLEILADAQKELDESRTNALMTGITIFGIISILDSLLSIYEVIAHGNPAEWLMLRTSIVVIMLLFMGFFLLMKKLK